jgi:hypothetical protein
MAINLTYKPGGNAYHLRVDDWQSIKAFSLWGIAQAFRTMLR